MIWKRLVIASSGFVWLGFASAGSASGQSSRELIPKSEGGAAIKTDGGRPLPLLSGGRLLSVEVNRTPEPVLSAVDANGRQEEVRFTIPGASYVLVHGMAAAADGTLVVHGSTYDNNSRGGSFLSIIAAVSAPEEHGRQARSLLPEGLDDCAGRNNLDDRLRREQEATQRAEAFRSNRPTAFQQGFEREGKDFPGRQRGVNAAGVRGSGRVAYKPV